MNRADLERWAAARTLADLSELTAQWLEGKISERPGYIGPPDDETTSLAPVLAACNRAGFLTEDSQPGGYGVYEGCSWSQRAAVQGFADPVTWSRIQVACDGLPVLIGAHRAPRWRNRYNAWLPVTQASGRVCTRFGAGLSRRFLEAEWACYVESSAVEAVRDAWQLTLIDVEWGRADSPLWTALAAFSGIEVTA